MFDYSRYVLCMISHWFFSLFHNTIFIFIFFFIFHSSHNTNSNIGGWKISELFFFVLKFEKFHQCYSITEKKNNRRKLLFNLFFTRRRRRCDEHPPQFNLSIFFSFIFRLSSFFRFQSQTLFGFPPLCFRHWLSSIILLVWESDVIQSELNFIFSVYIRESLSRSRMSEKENSNVILNFKIKETTMRFVDSRLIVKFFFHFVVHQYEIYGSNTQQSKKGSFKEF